MLRVLADHAVAWVLTGSTVLAVHGAEPVPNDLDVTPARDAANLRRLATALGALDAVPAFTPGWRDDFTLDTCRAWRPAPATEQQLEHLFVTRRGLLDVPVRMGGSYEQLVPTASRVVLAGVPVLVCDPVAVLDRAVRRPVPNTVPARCSTTPSGTGSPREGDPARWPLPGSWTDCPEARRGRLHARRHLRVDACPGAARQFRPRRGRCRHGRGRTRGDGRVLRAAPSSAAASER